VITSILNNHFTIQLSQFLGLLCIPVLWLYWLQHQAKVLVEAQVRFLPDPPRASRLEGWAQSICRPICVSRRKEQLLSRVTAASIRLVSNPAALCTGL
jgi:hypothetical protein